MVKGTAASVQKTVQQEETFQPEDEMTEKMSLTSGKKRINRDYFFPYFLVEKSQGCVQE